MPTRSRSCPGWGRRSRNGSWSTSATDSAATADLPSEGGPIVDVREALVSLGLTPQEAAEATRDVDADGREVDEMLREALQKAGR